MRSSLKNHLFVSISIFVVVFGYWLISQQNFIQYIYLFFGLLLGTFFLDIDHIIFWLYLKPDLDESRLAQKIIKNKDYKSILILFKTTHHHHNNLIFHHYFFQIALVLISFFVFTSSTNVFAMSFLLTLNTHLLVDEISDYQTNPKHLQNWLFARENKQLSTDNLKYYLGTFIVVTFLFLISLLRFKI